MEIWINKEVLTNKEVTNEGFITYTALRLIRDDLKGLSQRNLKQYITADMLCYTITNGTDYTRYFKKSIQDGLTNLIEVGILNPTIVGKDYIIDLKDVEFQTKNKDGEGSYFVKVNETYLDKIMKIEKVNKLGLWRYFVAMVSTFFNGASDDIDTKGKVGNMSITFFTEMIGIDKSTICGKGGYNEKLEENRIMYIYRCNDVKIVDGTVQNFNNYYSLYKDKEITHDYADAKCKGMGSKSDKKTNHEKRNKLNSFIQKYNYIVSNNYDNRYSTEEIQQIYNALDELEKRTKADCEIKNLEYEEKYDLDELLPYMTTEVEEIKEEESTVRNNLVSATEDDYWGERPQYKRVTNDKLYKKDYNMEVENMEQVRNELYKDIKVEEDKLIDIDALLEEEGLF